MGKPDITLDMATIITRELTIKGSFRYVALSLSLSLALSPQHTMLTTSMVARSYGAGVYQLAMDLVARGAVNLKSLISHRCARAPRHLSPCLVSSRCRRAVRLTA